MDYDVLLQLGFLTLLAVGVFFYSKRKKATVKNGFDAKAFEVAASGQATCNFDSFAGNLEAKESVKDIVDYLKSPEKFARYGARMPKGILLHGKPGTGKTLMARAMAGEAGVPFYAVSGSDFVQMYVGVGAARVRELFKKAREKKRAVIFIDEIDALGKKRSDNANGNDEREQTLNALLTEMQGFANEEGIVVVAATNRPDTLDDALLRPGRFDRRIEVALPDKNARRQIIDLHTKNKPISPEIDLDKLASDTVFFSGAMLEGLINDAAISAARKEAEHINQEDLTTAYYTALVGSEKKDRSLIRERDREITAWHEAGHAITAKLLNPETRIAKVSIIPSSNGAGGFCASIPPERMYYTKKDLENQMATALAGRAAEEIRFGKENITTGASNDIEKTTNLAMQYVTKFGMGERLADMYLLKNDQQAAEESANLVDRVYDETVKLLRDNVAKLQSLAELLLEKETVDEEDIVISSF